MLYNSSVCVLVTQIIHDKVMTEKYDDCAHTCYAFFKLPHSYDN